MTHPLHSEDDDVAHVAAALADAALGRGLSREYHESAIDALRRLDHRLAAVRAAIGEAWVRASDGDLAKAVVLKMRALEGLGGES